MFAGGKERLATPQSAIAVHQIYAATPSDTTLASRLAAAGNAMSDAQTMTAEISRYLIEHGRRSAKSGCGRSKRRPTG